MSAPGTKQAGRGNRRALTLLELVVVLVILVALAGLVVPMVGGLAFQSQSNAVMENLRRLQELIVNRYVPDMKGAYLASAASPGANPDGLPRGSPALPPQLKYLFVDPNAGTSAAGYNPTTGLGWNGPYALGGQGMYPGLSSSAASDGFVGGGTFGANNDPVPLDAWGNPIVVVPIHDTTHGQYYYALISAGSTGTLGSAIAGYAALQQPYASSQYSSSSGGTIWAVATPLEATITPGSASNANLDNASYGPVLTTTSDNTAYPYWLPLK